MDKTNKIRTMSVTTTLAIIMVLSSSSSLLSMTVANAQISQSSPMPAPIPTPVPTPEGQQELLGQLQQGFATFEQELLQLPPQQQQAAIFTMQQAIMHLLFQTPPELVPQTIQMLQLAMSPQLAQAVLFPVINQLQQPQPQPPGVAPLPPPQPMMPPQQPGNVPFPSAPMFPPSGNNMSSISPLMPTHNTTTATTSSSSLGTNNASSSNITTMTEISGVLVQPPPQEACSGSATDAFTNMLLCQADSLVSTFSPAIQEHKDSQYMPPSTQQELWDKCTTQATSANLVSGSYCAGLLQICANDRLTVEECYASFFVKDELWGNGSIPSNVATSILQKQAASQAATDAVYRAQMCPAPDGTWGDSC